MRGAGNDCRDSDKFRFLSCISAPISLTKCSHRVGTCWDEQQLCHQPPASLQLAVFNCPKVFAVVFLIEISRYEEISGDPVRKGEGWRTCLPLAPILID